MMSHLVEVEREREGERWQSATHTLLWNQLFIRMQYVQRGHSIWAVGWLGQKQHYALEMAPIRCQTMALWLAYHSLPIFLFLLSDMNVIGTSGEFASLLAHTHTHSN